MDVRMHTGENREQRAENAPVCHATLFFALDDAARIVQLAVWPEAVIIHHEYGIDCQILWAALRNACAAMRGITRVVLAYPSVFFVLLVTCLAARKLLSQQASTYHVCVPLHKQSTGY